MARVKKPVWVRMAIGAILVAALAAVEETAVQGQDRPSRAHSQLTDGIECYRRGDYELAASFFEQAEAGQDYLKDIERQELASQIKANNAALKARREGAAQLKKAQEAIQADRSHEALNLLRNLSANQYLTSADKLTVQKLMDQLQPAGAGRSGGTNGSPTVQARAKLQQARVLMSKGDFAAADALADEAEALKGNYEPGEDTPRRVKDDIVRARQEQAKAKAGKDEKKSGTTASAKPDAKTLLAQGRAAFDRGELDKAEQLAKDAQNTESMWTMHLWGDSPTKLLADIQAKRSKQALLAKAEKQSSEAAKPAAPSPKAGSAPAPRTTAADSDAARQFLKDGRKALQDHDLPRARELAQKAAQKKPDLEWWEDNPDKLLADVRQAETKAGTKTEEKTTAHVDPRQLLKQARDEYNAGNLDKARELAQKANAAPSAHWGLFEDSPDKLLVTIQKTRAKKDQEESAKLLVESRKLFEQGKYDEAEKKADRAARLHGPYSLWDLGDRPQKVVADCQTARAKQRKKLPQLPADAVAQDTAKKAAESGASAKASSPTNSQQAANRPATPPSGVGLPTPAGLAANSPPAPSWPSDNTPRPTALPPAPSPVVAVNGSMPSTPAAPTADLVKQNARRMMVEVRSLQRDGRLLEARQKAVECNSLGASFGPEEDRPELAIPQLNVLCEKQIELLMQRATDYANTAQTEPARLQKAEADLVAAKQLANGFGLDSQGIDRKMMWVKDLQAKAGIGTPNLLNSPAVQDPVGLAQHRELSPHERGLQLLAQGSRELRGGQLGVARRLAEEAAAGPYGVKDEALALLRSIETEEYAQKQLAAEHAFDALQTAYRRHDYQQAANLARQIDPHLLPPDKRSRLKDIMLTPDMREVNAVAAIAPGGIAPPAAAISPAPGTPAPADDYARQVDAMQQVKFQEMRTRGLETMRDATDRFQAGATDRALEILQEYKDQLEDSGLEPERVAMLRRPVDSRLQQFKTMKAAKEFDELAKQKMASARNHQNHLVLAEEQKQKQVKELMKDYTALVKEAKYREAEMAAVKARELDPDNPSIDAAIFMARTQLHLKQSQDAKYSREEMFVNTLNKVETYEGYDHTEVEDPVGFPKDWKKRTGNRKLYSGELGRKNDKEKEIERRLNEPITIEFKDTPLSKAIDDLRSYKSMNIVIDQKALEDEGIRTDQPVSQKLEGISMKSALNILLKRAGLTYIIADEVLQITTERNARGKLVQRTFPVADLIIPVDNYMIPATANLVQTLSRSGNSGQDTLRTDGASMLSPGSMSGGTPVGAGSSASPGSTGGNFATVSQTTTRSPSTNLAAGTRAPGQAQTIEDLLIRLITNTIKPQSWAEVGGSGTIDYFPLGMALVINQTPDVQEQVQDLLDALRRLQDLEVAVEVRMISLEEAFFERIGVNFNLNVNPKVPSQFQTQIVTQQFQGLNQVNNATPNSVIYGLTPAGSPTSDLFIPVTNSSYGMAIPPFGGYPNIPGADGGLSMGLAFLSDIQVTLLMEAAQGDRRTNIMQAPKITLFNGQTATIQVEDFQYFATNVQVIQSNGQVMFVPQNQPIPVGVSLTVQAVISADRRFVRLNLAPIMNAVSSATVPLFPVTTFITPVFQGGAQGQPVPFTQFLQQPTFTQISIQTTVSVPDGGTVLLGGLKLLNEGRNEFGPPILSKIPYIDRLFKNVGYGRDTSSLLIMVTPRVIINAEEELRQTGLNTGGPGGAGPIE